jgi:hypothetical protein
MEQLGLDPTEVELFWDRQGRLFEDREMTLPTDLVIVRLM